MLVEGISSLLASSAGITALLGTPTTRTDGSTGVFPSLVIDETTLPYIVYIQISRQTIMSYEGVNKLQEARFRFSCYGSTYKLSKQLAEQVKLVLDGFVGILSDGTPVENTMPISEIDDVDPVFKGTVYGVHLDYYFNFLDTGS